ncbi:MAG: right-handed parallel beta-helix repeat-containing protein, partial [Chloroflexota bacterium]
MTERRDPKQEDRMPERDTERLLAEWFEDEAPRQEPPVLLPAVLARTALTRRRRKWLTRDWWLSVLGLIDRRPPSMMVSVGFIAILTALALTAAFVVAPGGADNEKIERPADALVVAADGSGDFTTVRAAVDAAADGDTIFIEPGTYDESIGVDKSLSFIGGGNVAADVVIRAAASEPQALRVEGADVTLRRLAIERADPDDAVETPSGINILRGSIEIDDVEFLGIPDASCGLRSDAGNIFVGEGESVDVRVTVRDSRFGGSGADAIGICAGTIGSVTIERSSFEGLGLGLEGEAAEYDITDSTFRSNGIGLSAIGDVSIRNNAFLGNREGAISNGNGERNDVIIEGNDFVENGTAVRVGDRGWFQVKGNSFAGGQVGVRFSDGAPGSIVENDFRDLESSAIESRSAGPLIDGNTISGGLVGIVLRASDSWLMGNTIEGVRGTAIAVDASSDPKVVGNKLCDNGVGLDIPQGVGSTIGGNSTCTDAENRTWNVAQDGSGDFTTIGDAVDAAIDGDVVLVQPGIYDESIVVGKDVSITGQPDGSEVVVEVSAPFPRPRDDASMDRLNYDDPPFAFWIVDSDAVLENYRLTGPRSHASAKATPEGFRGV